MVGEGGGERMVRESSYHLSTGVEVLISWGFIIIIHLSTTKQRPILYTHSNTDLWSNCKSTTFHSN